MRSVNSYPKKTVISRKELDGMAGQKIHTRKFNNDYHFEMGVE